MEEKMKKMLFLMLFLLILGAASVSSQVRIGGNGVPNGAAVLDLNATDAINNGTKTLALPRVSLASTTDQLGYATLLNGMLVYNTNTTSGAGVYYWATNQWMKVSDGAFTEVDGVIGNEITDTILNGGLTRSGAGTAESPYKVGVKAGGIVDGMVAMSSINVNKLATQRSDSGYFLMSDGVNWTIGSELKAESDGPTVTNVLAKAVTWSATLDTTFACTIPARQSVVVRGSGIARTSLCRTLQGGPIQPHAPQRASGVAIVNEFFAAWTGVVRVVCFTPSW